MLEFAAAVPVLRVSDLVRSANWYETILGFSVLTSSSTQYRLRRDDVELLLRRASAPAAPRVHHHEDWDVAFHLRGGVLIALLDEARRRTPLVRGPEVMPDGRVEFELADPDGYRICLAETISDTRGIPSAL